MDKIKRYFDCYVPVTTCTLRCHYCYVTLHRKFEGPLPKFQYSPQHVRKALSKERLGGTCLINFCADGETLLTPQIVDYVRVLLEEGHYVMIVTNATVTQRLEELAKLKLELRNHLFFKFSYHFLELKKKGLLEKFFTNITMMRDAGCSFTLEVTPSDELIPFIDELKNIAVEKLGAVPHVTIARDEKNPEELPILTNLSRDEYKKVWSSFDSKLFDYKMEIFEVKRKEFCYAGEWSGYLNLLTGELRQCYRSQVIDNIFEDVNRPIKFRPVGHHCIEHHCYNGHSYLVLGDIPELVSPYYSELRNRICKDGSEWLKPEVKAFMHTKLKESNREYSGFEKWYYSQIQNYANIRRSLLVRLRSLKKMVVCTKKK